MNKLTLVYQVRCLFINQNETTTDTKVKIPEIIHPICFHEPSDASRFRSPYMVRCATVSSLCGNQTGDLP